MLNGKSNDFIIEGRVHRPELHFSWFKLHFVGKHTKRRMIEYAGNSIQFSMKEIFEQIVDDVTM